MKKNLIQAAAVALPLAFVGGNASADAFAAENFSLTATFTTDYVFRGVSFSSEGPAIQGSVDWGYNGFYLGVWGSNLDLEDATGDTSHIELDFYGGYANSWNGLDYDLTLIYYHFPGAPENWGTVAAPAKLETDQFEVWLTLGYGFENVPLEPYVGFFYAYSPDFTLEDGDGHAVEGSLALSLPWGFGLDGMYGYQTVDGDKATGRTGLFCDPTTGVLCGGYSYNYWSVGLTHDLAGFDLDLRYHDTDGDANDFFGTAITGSRVVFTVSRTFGF